MTNPSPRYVHDCDRCTYIGQTGEYDLYYCGGGSLGGSVIARFSSEGHEYASSPFEMFAYSDFGSDAGAALKEGANRVIGRFFQFNWPQALDTIKTAHQEALRGLETIDPGMAFYKQHMGPYLEILMELAKGADNNVDRLKILYGVAKLLAYAGEEMGYKLVLNYDDRAIVLMREEVLPLGGDL